MSTIRKIPQPEGGRVETGAVQFEGDWPGIFIRGDNALAYGYMLSRLPGLIKLLESCHARNFGDDVEDVKP